MDKVELRRRRIINIIYLAIILGLSYLFLKYCFGMVFPLLFSFFIAIIVQKPSNYIVRKTKLSKGITSTLVVLLLFVSVVFVVSLLGVRLVDAGKSFVDFIVEKLSDLPSLIDDVKNWVINAASILPDSIETKFVASATAWFDVLRDKSAAEIAALIMDSASGGSLSLSSLSTPLNGIWSTAKQIPSVFVAVIISIVCSCFVAADYDRLVFFIKNQLSEKHRHKLSVSKRVVFKSIGKLIRSYVLIILITCAEIFIGLNILSLFKIYSGEHIFAISIVVALLDILPVLGTGTFMIPWAVYSFIIDDVALGIGLLIIYAIIYIVRQIIEPKLVAGTVGLPPFVTLMGMYIGTQLFGFIGIFLVPVLIIIVKLLNDEGVIHLWKSSVDYSSSENHTEKASDKISRLFAKLKNK